MSDLTTEHGAHGCPERIVYIDYDPDGRPKTLMTEYDLGDSRQFGSPRNAQKPTGVGYALYYFDFSRADSTFYWHEAGSGSHPIQHLMFGKLFHPEPPGLFWTAPSMQGIPCVSDEQPHRPLTPAEVLAWGHRRLDEPLDLTKPLGGTTRDPFELAVQAETLYCHVCDDYYTSDCLEPCDHLCWDDEVGDWVGEGTYEAQMDKESA